MQNVSAPDFQYPVREGVARAQDQAWDAIGRAGSWWSGAQRVEIANQARAARKAGVAGFVEAACVVGIFNGLVRTADASGIPLDEGTRAATADYRRDLGLEAMFWCIYPIRITHTN